MRCIRLQILCVFLGFTSLLQAQIGTGLELDAEYLINIPAEPNGLGVQDDAWSCGPNALSKILRFYDYTDATYIQVRNFTAGKVKKVPLIGVELGTTADVAKEILNHWDEEQHGDYIEGAELLNVLVELSNNNPVALLVHLGSSDMAGPKFPLMHWIVLVGYNSKRDAFKVMDSNDTSYWISRDQLLIWWNFNFDDYNPLVRSVVNAIGYKERTMAFLRIP